MTAFFSDYTQLFGMAILGAIGICAVIVILYTAFGVAFDILDRQRGFNLVRSAVREREKNRYLDIEN